MNSQEKRGILAVVDEINKALHKNRSALNGLRKNKESEVCYEN